MTPSVHIPDPAGEVLRFAAEELSRYAARLLGARPGIAPAPELPPASLLLGGAGPGAVPAAPDGPDAFRIEPTPDGVALRGASERAVLHAVYAFLEQAGCRWSFHGPEEELVPRLPGLPAATAVVQRPPFHVRGYAADIMTWHYQDRAQLASRADEDRAFVDWMGKSGGNAFFFIRHPFDSQLTIPALLPEFRRRGIAVEYGGHVLPLLLPREEFAAHPDYFPVLSDGGRSDHGNLCVSNAAALGLASRNAVGYVERHPELSVLHVWGADLWGGGWCRCGACAALTPQDQSLLACNAIARALAAAGCSRPVCYLAYHDTIEPALGQRPEDGVVVEFAPRERCYGHALDDPACATNPRYRAALERYVELFAGRVRLFEYYGDAILFCGSAVPLSDVIAADLAFARRLGIDEITLLQFGTYSLWAYPLNLLAYAAGTSGRPCAAAPAYASRFGPHAARMARALAALEAVMRSVVTYGDIRRPPRDAGRATALAPRIAAALVELRRLGDELGAVADARVADQAALVRYTATVLEGVLEEISAPGGGRERALALYDRAQEIVRSVDRAVKGLWGEVDLAVIHSFHSSGAFRMPGAD